MSELRTTRKKETFTPTGENVKSSIFGRDVSYERVTPKENIAMPIDSKDIRDMLQIRTTLYFLTDGAVYTLDIESGESGRLFDTDAKMFANMTAVYIHMSLKAGSCAHMRRMAWQSLKLPYRFSFTTSVNNRAGREAHMNRASRLLCVPLF